MNIVLHCAGYPAAGLFDTVKLTLVLAIKFCAVLELHVGLFAPAALPGAAECTNAIKYITLAPAGKVAPYKKVSVPPFIVPVLRLTVYVVFVVEGESQVATYFV